MTQLIALDALVARADRVEEIVAPQYDSLAHGGRYQYAVDRPDCFLNVVLSRSDFPAGDLRESDIAARARDHFSGMVDRGLFARHEAPAFFLYELDTGAHRQVGLVAGIPVGAIDGGVVLGHEGTLHEHAADLATFFRTARLSSSPVALAFRPHPAQQALFQQVEDSEPIRDFTGWDGVRQRLWVIDDPETVAAFQEAMATVPTFYITDGHHRVAAAQHEGAVPGWFLGVMFPSDQMQVLEYNRCVSLEGVVDVRAVHAALEGEWELEELGVSGGVDARPDRIGDLSMLVDGTWHRVRFVGDRPLDPVEGLDVCLLHDRVLAPAFGVQDDQDGRLAFVVGEDAASRLEEVVRSEPNTVAFALHPTTVDELFAVADAGKVMPAKSTWFTPKPRSGLVVVTW